MMNMGQVSFSGLWRKEVINMPNKAFHRTQSLMRLRR